MRVTVVVAVVATCSVLSAPQLGHCREGNMGAAVGGGVSMYFPAMEIEDLPGAVIGMNVLPGVYYRTSYLTALANLSVNVSYLKVKAGEQSRGGMGFGYGADLAAFLGSGLGFYISPKYKQWSLDVTAGKFSLSEFFTNVGMGYVSDRIAFSLSIFRVGVRPQAESMVAFSLDFNFVYLF